MTLNLKQYRVDLMADNEYHTLVVYAAGKRQAGTAASKTTRSLVNAKTIQVKRIVERT